MHVVVRVLYATAPRRWTLETLYANTLLILASFVQPAAYVDGKLVGLRTDGSDSLPNVISLRAAARSCTRTLHSQTNVLNGLGHNSGHWQGKGPVCITDSSGHSQLHTGNFRTSYTSGLHSLYAVRLASISADCTPRIRNPDPRGWHTYIWQQLREP